ncbi:hypothetical protein JDY09_04085 [Thermoleophilum album]|uniref:hypothetical protein n=1 Tax=Thermoleophilum album TaxID=29539 RepID=UPI00237CAC9C|nr:hypothetical protein [Thermoleophilum album]WDT94440.1 hypothetical protein JDY09_04085 [Thermoleophilum album]
MRSEEGREIKLLRMKPGYGEVLLAEGDRRSSEDAERLAREFERQIAEGMWAAVPLRENRTGRRRAVLVKHLDEVPDDADTVIFIPRAQGGSLAIAGTVSTR